MKNAIYEGSVLHHRLAPKEHGFTYKVCYYFFDLGRPQELITLPLLLSFKAKNYLNEQQIRKNLTEKFGPIADASIKKVFILTQLSYFGFCFNPVSFYYCFGENEELLYVLSQITNTPWGEKHINCFDFKKTKGEMNFPKDFHVSPFMPMEINYVWNFNYPQNTIQILMKNRHSHEQKFFFQAQMALKAKDWSLGNVIVSFIFYPFMSFKTVLGIYWQALILYLKRVPFYTHPKKRELV